MNTLFTFAVMENLPYAAAPELLAILQLAERYLTHPDVVEVTKNFALSGEVINRRIAAAIAKATS